jgi:hypothetical protein
MSMNGRNHLSYRISSRLNHGQKANRSRFQLALHLHDPTITRPTILAARPQKRADLWWCDSIPDFQRLFPAPSSTKVISIRLAKQEISHGKDAGSKVAFEPSPA